MGRRAEAEDVQQHRLVVALPAIWQEAAFRLPPERDGAVVDLRPAPVGAPVQRVGQRADFFLLAVAAVEVAGGGQGARQQEGGVDRRQLALPCAAAGLHVEEVIVEAAVAGGVGLGAVRAVPEESQRRQRALDRRGARNEAALDADRVHGQREADGGDAGRPAGRALVDHQAVDRIGFLHKIGERFALEHVQLDVGRRRFAAHCTTPCLAAMEIARQASRL